MSALLLVIAGAALLTVLYLLCIKPGPSDKERFAPFEGTLIAHRGLYDNKTDSPENSLAAFRKAVDAGFGIEFDIQITKDGKLVVFHDENLKRMCGADTRLVDHTFKELQQYTLADSDEHIPLFEEVMEVFRDKVPVIIELKAHGSYIAMSRKLMDDYMDGYEGSYCVESFHPAIVGWFRRHHPEVIRGQLSTVFSRASKAPWVAKFVCTNLLSNIYARPDFIAYDFRHADQFSYRLLRRLFRVENVAWTIKSEEDLDTAGKTFDVFIFDSFVPEQKDR